MKTLMGLDILGCKLSFCLPLSIWVLDSKCGHTDLCGLMSHVSARSGEHNSVPSGSLTVSVICLPRLYSSLGVLFIFQVSPRRYPCYIVWQYPACGNLVSDSQALH